MADVLSDGSLNQLFREARTHQYFDGREVSDEQIHAIWELAKMGPTSMNQLPARIVWCKSDAAKERLAAHAAPGNVEKVRNAPVCAIVAMDVDFHEQLPQLFPHGNGKAMFDGKPEARETSAFRNSSLQGGYLILAARALGLDCGPMSGFNNAAVDADFFADDPSWKSNFICSIGYGDPTRLHERSPRPDFGAFNRLI
ncbi:malonic semialdehyde reductase [Alteraurantiacibacter aestuarii]|uniref:Malonic semialdehyde reductase n=1 Tax=Alteraurantiacibacter aestuarii TaxID=650004 RepID=A0A844ZK51_9SPHN|nr:malonic semialdehyde reductase [Alteraurantiacibacter aestuarii]MXO87873.1 malonic semialdehyde reductase [Alteraurantiacibacter aestuarii]